MSAETNLLASHSELFCLKTLFLQHAQRYGQDVLGGALPWTPTHTDNHKQSEVHNTQSVNKA
jgi:hypothetical protein